MGHAGQNWSLIRTALVRRGDRTSKKVRAIVALRDNDGLLCLSSFVDLDGELTRIDREMTSRNLDWAEAWCEEIEQRINRALVRAWRGLPQRIRKTITLDLYVEWFHTLLGAKILTEGQGRRYVEDGHAARLATVIARARRGNLKQRRLRSRAQFYEFPGELCSVIAENLLQTAATVARGEALGGETLRDLQDPPEIDRQPWGPEMGDGLHLSLDAPVDPRSDTTHADTRSRDEPDPSEAAAWAEIALEQIREAHAARAIHELLFPEQGVRLARRICAQIARRSRKGSGRRWAARFYCRIRSGTMRLTELAHRSGLAKSTLSAAIGDVEARIRRDPAIRQLAG